MKKALLIISVFCLSMLGFSCRKDNAAVQKGESSELTSDKTAQSVSDSPDRSASEGEPPIEEPVLTGIAALKVGPLALTEPEQDIFQGFEAPEPSTEYEFLRDLITEDGTYVLLVKTESGYEVLPQRYDAVLDPYYGNSPYKISSDFWFLRYGYERRYVPVMKDGKWGYADMCRGGELLVPAVFDDIHPFREGLGAVKKGKYWGFTDGTRMVTPLCFLSVQDFFNGLCVVTYNDVIGCIRKDNTLAFAYPYSDESKYGLSSIMNFHDPEITSADNGSRAVLADGSIPLEQLTLGGSMERHSDKFDFSYADGTLCVRAQFNEELFATTGSESKSSLYGAFNRSGNWVYEPVYSLKELEKLLKVGSAPEDWLGKKDENGLFGFVDDSDNWVIEPQFLKWSRFYSGRAKVTNAEGKVGFIRTDGSYIIEPVYDDISYSSIPNTYRVKKGNRFGLIDSDGNTILPCEYDYTNFASESFPIEMRQGEKFGCINENGEWVCMLEEGDKVRSKNGLMLIFHPAFERPAVKEYAKSYRVCLYLADGTPLFPESAFYEEFFEDGP